MYAATWIDLDYMQPPPAWPEPLLRTCTTTHVGSCLRLQNDYSPADYVSAWGAIVGAYRSHSAELAARVAAVWDYSCDAGQGRRDWTQWYPGNSTPPDWWGVNIYSGNSLASSACVTKYVDAAEAAGFPVMLGESTPRTFGVLDDPWALVSLGAPHADAGDSANDFCIGVSGASTADNATVVTWSCEPGPNQLWRINPDGFMVNLDGKCLGVGGSTGSALATPLVIGECGGPETTTPPLRFREVAGGGGGSANTSRILVVDGGAEARCIRAASSAGDAAPVVLATCEGALATWRFIPTSIGGARRIWATWFTPYLALINRTSVKAFCYIDWFWPAFSNHQGFNWYNWGDARMETSQSSTIGALWRGAMQTGSAIIGASNQSALCARLGC